MKNEKLTWQHRFKWQHYWELVWFKTYTDLKIETQINYLGFVWWFLEPILFMALYYFIFGIVLKTHIQNFLFFLLIGNVVLRWIGPSMMRACRSVQMETKLMQDVYVSKLLFPICIVLSDAFKFTIVFSCVLIILAIFQGKPSILWLTIIPNFITQAILILGLSFCFSAITSCLPDFYLIVQLLLPIIILISGVFFDILEIPGNLAYLLQLNPIADVLINYRLPLLYHHVPQWNYMVYTFFFGIALNIIGIYTIRKNDRIFILMKL